jgi:hypothetical protein
MPRNDTHVALDLRPDGEQIAGTVRADGRQPLPFVGWLELAALLDQARRVPVVAIDGLTAEETAPAPKN